tara:strand:+ start:527433 stop:528236 length:804 start_codon:yes stop_codon:yes gene_type:complete
LEKSLSLTDRDPASGRSNTLLLKGVVDKASEANDFGYQDRVAINVLRQFSAQIKDDGEGARLNRELEELEKIAAKEGGIFEFDESAYKDAILPDPESFFLSRFSLREFSPRSIDDQTLQRAIKMAMKSPSVCNRQAWHVYDIDDPLLIEKALTLQSGNRGFGHKISKLLIITSDLKAFFSSKERYQHWIDGGLFSMSLILAFHSLGISSCCLNWSQGASADIKLRRALPIKPEHSVIMMLTIGYPNVANKVCQSPRRPLEEIYTKLS